MKKIMELNKKTEPDFNSLAITWAEEFITWRDSLHYIEIPGEEIMFEVEGHYKRLKQSELLTYYMDFVRF